MKIFIFKSIVITVCLIILSYFWKERYEFLDNKTRGDKFQGTIEFNSQFDHWSKR